MPIRALKSMSKKAGKSLKDAERYWEQGKKAGSDKRNKYAYAMGITKKRLGLEDCFKSDIKLIDGRCSLEKILDNKLFEAEEPPKPGATPSEDELKAQKEAEGPPPEPGETHEIPSEDELKKQERKLDDAVERINALPEDQMLRLLGQIASGKITPKPKSEPKSGPNHDEVVPEVVVSQDERERREKGATEFQNKLSIAGKKTSTKPPKHEKKPNVKTTEPMFQWPKNTGLWFIRGQRIVDRTGKKGLRKYVVTWDEDGTQKFKEFPIEGSDKPTPPGGSQLTKEEESARTAALEFRDWMNSQARGWTPEAKLQPLDETTIEYEPDRIIVLGRGFIKAGEIVELPPDETGKRRGQVNINPDAGWKTAAQAKGAAGTRSAAKGGKLKGFNVVWDVSINDGKQSSKQGFFFPIEGSGDEALAKALAKAEKRLSLKAGTMAEVTINNPEGWRIYIDNRPQTKMDKSPLMTPATFKTTAGVRNITLAKDGYKDMVTLYDVKPQIDNKVAFKDIPTQGKSTLRDYDDEKKEYADRPFVPSTGNNRDLTRKLSPNYRIEEQYSSKLPDGIRPITQEGLQIRPEDGKLGTKKQQADARNMAEYKKLCEQHAAGKITADELAAARERLNIDDIQSRQMQRTTHPEKRSSEDIVNDILKNNPHLTPDAITAREIADTIKQRNIEAEAGRSPRYTKPKPTTAPQQLPPNVLNAISKLPPELANAILKLPPDTIIQYLKGIK